MLYRIPIQFGARPYRGIVRRKSVRLIDVEAQDQLTACRLAREKAAVEYMGKRMANGNWVYTFKVHSVEVLDFYSACDCCDILMHHSTVGEGYFVMKDGRTLCAACLVGDEGEIDQ